MTVYKEGVDVASFGAVQRLGAENDYHFVIGDSKIAYWSNSTVNPFKIVTDYNGCLIYGRRNNPSFIRLNDGLLNIQGYDKNAKEYRVALGYNGSTNKAFTNVEFEAKTITQNNNAVVDKSMMATGSFSSTSVPARGYKDFTINSFGKTFSSTPTVTATLVSTSNAYQIGYLSVAVLSTSTTGATLRVFNADSTSRAPAINWIAIGI